MRVAWRRVRKAFIHTTKAPRQVSPMSKLLTVCHNGMRSKSILTNILEIGCKPKETLREDLMNSSIETSAQHHEASSRIVATLDPNELELSRWDEQVNFRVAWPVERLFLGFALCSGEENLRPSAEGSYFNDHRVES